jgi:hypothetical protein
LDVYYSVTKDVHPIRIYFVINDSIKSNLHL